MKALTVLAALVIGTTTAAPTGGRGVEWGFQALPNGDFQIIGGCKNDEGVVDKIDPRLVRHAFEEGFIDRGLTSSEVLRLLERAKESCTSPQ